MDTVYVLLSTYNGEQYLGRQLDTILAQRDVDVRLMVRDDGSKDGTVGIIRKYQQEFGNITLFEGENVGYVKSFMWLINHVENVQGAFYAFSDQDDIWDPEKLISGVEKLKKMDAGKPLLYYSDLKVVDENENYIRRANTWQGTFTKYTFSVFIGIRGCTMVFNDVLHAMLKPCITKNISGHDNYIPLIPFWMGQVVYDDNAYINYRQSGGNASLTGVSRWDAFKKNIIYTKKRLTVRKNIHENNAKELLSHYYTDHAKELEELKLVAEYRRSLRSRFALMTNPNFKKLPLKVRLFNDLYIILGKL